MSDAPAEQVENTVTKEEDVDDVELPDDDDDAGQGDSGVTKGSLLQNPAVLAAIQGKLGQMVGQSSGYIETLPKVVKRRIKALKKLQSEVVKSESKFYEEVHELECKYALSYAALFERRREILTGAIEPTDSDCEWPSDEEEDEEKLAEVKEKASIEDGKDDKDDEDTKGIPSFWLTIFRNVDMLSELTQEHDEPIIKCLNDIKVSFQSAPTPGFTLEFVFDENDYFSDTVLTKHYDLRIEPDEKEQLAYEGPEIVKCKGCTINWKPGKNVTVKTVKKKQKHKGRGTVRTVTKTVPNESFFNFFSPPDVSEEDEDDDDTESLLAADYEVGHFLRERVVPRAVLYFTGEALDEDDDEYDEDDDNEDGDDDDDDENDADYNPATDPAKPADCKSQ